MHNTSRWPGTIIFTVVIGVSLLAGGLSSYSLTQNGEKILTTLATVQAAIFAIVFSVVILGIQLSTSRYSARLANLFRTDAEYQKTVTVFILSIGVDVFALIVFHSIGVYWLRFLLTLAVMLSLVAVILLYFFVDRTLEQTTPEGIIQRVEQELTPDRIIQKANTAENEPTEPDPFQVPVSIIRSAIDDRDLPAISLGLDVIGNQIDELLKRISEDEVEEETPVGSSLEQLCTNRLPEVSKKAVETNLDDSSCKTVATLISIGETGVDEQQEPILVYISEGLSELVGTLGFESAGEKTRQKAILEVGELLEDAAEAELWNATGTGIRILGWRTGESVSRRGPTDRNQRGHTSLCVGTLPDTLRKVAEGVPEDLDDGKIVRGVIRRDGEYSCSPEQWALWSCYAAMAEMTSAFLRYELKHEEQIADWSMISYGWRECVSILSETDFDLLCQLWLGTSFYLDYIRFESSSRCMSGFRLNAPFDLPPEFVIETIDTILTEKIDPISRIDLLPGRVNPVELPQSGFSSPPVSNPDRTFEEWLKIRKTVYDKTGHGGWGMGAALGEELEKPKKETTKKVRLSSW
jgi:hypothetical protein